MRAGLAYLTITLVAVSIEVGIVLEHPDSTVDPTADGPLAHANMLLHGSVARLLTALLLAAAGYAILRTRVLPAWTGVAAYIVSAFNLAFVPSLYFGTETAQFYSAIGWGNSATASGLLTLWVLAAVLARPRDLNPPGDGGNGWCSTGTVGVPTAASTVSRVSRSRSRCARLRSIARRAVVRSPPLTASMTSPLAA